MIETVTMERSTYAPVPHKFEAGTPPIVEAVGLGAAVDYLSVLGMDHVHRHEQTITAYALEGLQTVPGLSVLGPARRDAAWGRDLVRDPRRAPPRRRHRARLAWDRRPRRSPLRQARPCQVRRAELDPDVVLPLHDAGRIDALVDGLEYTRRYFKLD